MVAYVVVCRGQPVWTGSGLMDAREVARLIVGALVLPVVGRVAVRVAC